MIRLSAKIATALAEAIETNVAPARGSELFLFGSRVDPLKKGGDIDLLLVTDEETKARAQLQKLELRSVLRDAARDQKVDLSVVTAEERNADAFFSTIDRLVSLRKF